MQRCCISLASLPMCALNVELVIIHAWNLFFVSLHALTFLLTYLFCNSKSFWKVVLHWFSVVSSYLQMLKIVLAPGKEI